MAGAAVAVDIGLFKILRRVLSASTGRKTGKKRKAPEHSDVLGHRGKGPPPYKPWQPPYIETQSSLTTHHGTSEKGNYFAPDCLGLIIRSQFANQLKNWKDS